MKRSTWLLGAAVVVSALPRSAAAQSCGDLLVIFDRSGSMVSCSVNGVTKEALAKAAVKKIVDAYPSMPVGLAVFPDTTAMCMLSEGCTTGRVTVDVSATGGAQVKSYLDGMQRSCGGTPTGASLQAVQDYGMWTPGKVHYVLLLTDGMPTCQDDVELMCDGMGSKECTNPTRAYNAIDHMYQQGVYTFVVGFEGFCGGAGQLNPKTLNQMADLGGVPNDVGMNRYYSANDEASLNAVLAKIADKVAGGGTIGGGCAPPAPRPADAGTPAGQDAGGAGHDAGGIGGNDGGRGVRDSSGCACHVGGDEARGRLLLPTLLVLAMLARLRRRG